MLDNILKEKKCFKLICGAGNENIDEVEKLVYLYSCAGCNFFDLSANIEVLKAAKSGINRSNIQKNRYLCVSIGIKGDPHTIKANIKNSCIKCLKCKEACPQNAFIENSEILKIDEKKCIGCKKCSQACNNNSIEYVSKPKNPEIVLPEIIEFGIDCIEFHMLSNNIDDIYNNWNIINKLYNGMVSICVDRSLFGDKKLVDIVSDLIKQRKPYTTIIQADGAPMSGGCDDYKTTLQAIACAEMFEKADLPTYIIVSGGTNSKTMGLAKLCNINISGIAVGSYARKIVKEYIAKNDFYENKQNYKNALSIAKNLINTV